jgi:hypothetical protein
MLGCRRDESTRSSSRRRRSARGFPACCALGMIFTAISRPVRLHLAARTTLKPPRPIMGPTAYAMCSRLAIGVKLALESPLVISLSDAIARSKKKSGAPPRQDLAIFSLTYAEPSTKILVQIPSWSRSSSRRL